MSTISPMQASQTVGLAEEPEVRLSAGDQRRLARRGWWARHPWVTDALVALVYAVLASGIFLYAEIFDLLIDPPAATLSVLVLVASIAAILLRRRWTWTMSIVVLVLGLVSMFHSASADFFAVPIMIFTLAVHRSARSALVYFLLALGTIVIAPFLPWTPRFSEVEDGMISIVLFASAVIGLLAGLVARGRRMYVAALVEQAALLEREKQMVGELSAERERTRIAREMHDIVSHTLTVVVTLADGAVAARDETAARGAMAASATAARGALGDLRRLLGALRDDSAAAYSPQIDASSIPETVERFVDIGLPVRLTVTGEGDEDAVFRLAVLRVVQEGLTNALRYSKSPQAVDVMIDHRPEGTEVQVRNDGAVADAPSVGTGQGLLGVQERVGMLGGEVHAGPAGAGEWLLRAWIPAPAAGQEKGEVGHG